MLLVPSKEGLHFRPTIDGKDLTEIFYYFFNFGSDMVEHMEKGDYR